MFIVVYIIILLLLILLSAFFSASETALTSISKLRIKHLINERGDKSSGLNIWLSDPARIITIILILNNIINITASSMTTWINITYFPKINIWIGTSFITLILLIFGEIVPKNSARRSSEELAINVIKPLNFLANIFSPLVKLLVIISNFVIKLFHLPGHQTAEVVTEQDIKMMIDIGHKEGVVEKSEKEMLHRIFRFHDTNVKSVMTPKERMICGHISMSIKELIELIIIKGHSRIPIYDSNFNNILGIIYERDILYCIKENLLITINDCLREPFKTNEDTMINELLHNFQTKMIQIAIVVDKQDKPIGLVTIEDLLEEIVGEIDEKLSKKKYNLL